MPGKSVNTISGYGGDGKSIKTIELLSESAFIQLRSMWGIILGIITECKIPAKDPAFFKKKRN